MARLAIALIAVFALGAGSARAAEVKVATTLSCDGDLACEKYSGDFPHHSLSFTAAPGEANDVTVSGPADTVTVHDAGAVLTAGDRCTSSGDHDVTCDLSGAPRAPNSIALGDGNDRLVVSGSLAAQTVVDGGDGDDDVTGGGEVDQLKGGLGRDKLAGGAGNDTLMGGGATASGESIEADVLDGGPGEDTADYRLHKVPIGIDLLQTEPSQGADGEGDTLIDIEDVYGGSGGDDLLGDSNDNVLMGEGGGDILTGSEGNDTLEGGPGDDVYSGGAGNDSLDTRDGRGEVVDCGAGHDLVGGVRLGGVYLDEQAWIGPNATDLIARNCDRVALDGDPRATPFPVSPLVLRRGAIVSLPNPCRVRRAPRSCSGVFSAGVSGKGKPGRTSFKRGPARVRVKLSPRSRQAAARGTPMAVKLSLRLGSNSYVSHFSVIR